MKLAILSNGVFTPLLGFGVFQIFDPEQYAIEALHAGYRLIDTMQA